MILWHSEPKLNKYYKTLKIIRNVSLEMLKWLSAFSPSFNFNISRNYLGVFHGTNNFQVAFRSRFFRHYSRYLQHYAAISWRNCKIYFGSLLHFFQYSVSVPKWYLCIILYNLHLCTCWHLIFSILIIFQFC